MLPFLPNLLYLFVKHVEYGIQKSIKKSKPRDAGTYLKLIDRSSEICGAQGTFVSITQEVLGK